MRRCRMVDWLLSSFNNPAGSQFIPAAPAPPVTSGPARFPLGQRSARAGGMV